MKFCLNMIVKNESARIERALASVVQFIDSWVIVDTGSTDDTKDKITAFFKTHQIVGEIRDEPFNDWSQARNAALSWARALAPIYQPDYILLMDADMELVVKDVEQFLAIRVGDSYEMYQAAGATHYTNSRLVRVDTKGGYRGVTHEYLDIPSAGVIPEDVAYFLDHADGSNRVEKYKRDIRLLKRDLKTDPNNARSFYYLAQSYRDAGLPVKALQWFQRRVDAGGWDEERWYAQLGVAHAHKDLGHEAEFIRNLWIAYNMRPTRAESLYDLANYYRHGNMQAAALAAAETVEHLTTTTDKLFVNRFVYDVGIKEEISINAFYVPHKRDKGYRVTSELAMQAGPYVWQREQARNNMFHYLQPLKSFCPSFKGAALPFQAAEGWTPLNPSVTLHQGKLLCNIRTVNYRIDGEGRYMIRGTDGTANAENPINTRNFLVNLGDDPFNPPPGSACEIFAPDSLPCAFPLVVGFEDTRLISTGNELWSSSTVRQIHPDGNCEQVLAKVSYVHSENPEGPEPSFMFTDVKRMLRMPRQTEKNWAAIVEAGRIRFMWRPLEVVNTDGVTVSKHDPGVAVDNISGSSQLIPFRSVRSFLPGWLAITHEARCLPGSHLRYYYHRFAYYDEGFTKVRFSRPFFFNDKSIEFCAGMCWHPTDNHSLNKTLVISYGVRDCEAWIATVSAAEVEDFLWQDQQS